MIPEFAPGSPPWRATSSGALTGALPALLALHGSVALDRRACVRVNYIAYAHRCGGALSLRPLSPCPYNAAVPKGPAFSFLNYYYFVV